MSIASLDVSFERRLDRWLSSFRLAVGCAGLLLVFSLVSEPYWALAAGGAYVVASGAVFPLLRMAGDDPRKKRWLRLLILGVDVATVSLFAYGLGSRASPAMFMYVPVVVGWTLIPEQGLGRVALVLVVLSLATVLALEHAELMLQSSMVRGGRLVFFGIAGLVLVAVHILLAHTVSQLVEHGRLVSALRTENETLEREAAWAARLEEAQRLEALGRLAGGVAHDFNNLLTALIGCAEMAESCLHSAPEAARAALRDLQHAAERGAGLTAQLLDAAGRRPSQPQNLDLGRAVAQTDQLLKRLLRDDVALRLSFENDEPLGVRIDPSSLQRLLLNLSVNAADAMPTGGALTFNAQLAGRDARHVELTVSDTGVGIARDELAHIFEPFFTNKARGKGTGLGLASVYGIVKQSGGTIEVDSTLGEGTRFRMLFPRVDLPAANEAPVAGPARAFGTVLLVDDDDMVRKVTEAHLRKTGYAVVTARSAAEGLALVTEGGRRFDALISDVSMPGMSGTELVATLRSRGHALPVLLVSGYADELRPGAEGTHESVAFLGKPFPRERLARELERLLQTAAERVR